MLGLSGCGFENCGVKLGSKLCDFRSGSLRLCVVFVWLVVLSKRILALLRCFLGSGLKDSNLRRQVGSCSGDGCGNLRLKLAFCVGLVSHCVPLD